MSAITRFVGACLQAMVGRIARKQASASLVALVFFAVSARAEIELLGVFATSTRSAFALTDQPGKPATWLALGATFGGYSLESFDTRTDTLTLRKGADLLRVRLKDDAKVKNARIEIAGVLTFSGAEKIELARATLLFDQENVFPLKDGFIWRITPKRLPDGNILYDALVDRTSPDGKLERVSAPRLIALPNGPFSIQIGGIGFSFAPKIN